MKEISVGELEGPEHTDYFPPIDLSLHQIMVPEQNVSVMLCALGAVSVFKAL